MPHSPRHEFRRTRRTLSYRGEGWSATARPHAGWTSLRVGRAEFLHAAKGRGGFAYLGPDGLSASFPDLGRIGAELDGRYGAVGDGVYTIRVTPDLDRPGCELYAGFNDEADHDLILYLAGDVRLIRVIDPETERARWRPLRPDEAAGPVEARAGVLLVHRQGPAVVVHHACRLGPMPHPDGGERAGLAFTCRGHAPNAIDLAFEPKPRAATFAHEPRFQVTSNHDGEVQGRATRGVQNPTLGPASEIDFNTRFEWLGETPFNGTAELEMVHALGKRHCHQRVGVAEAAGDTRLHFDPELTMPGVSDVWGRLYDDRGELVWVDRYRLLYDYERFEPDVRPPGDLESFWREALETMRSRPLDARFERIHEDDPDLELYDVSFNALHEHRVHAILSVPKDREGLLPAIVASHPGTTGLNLQKRPDGVYGSKLKRDPRFAQITPLVRGHAVDADDVPFNHPWWGPLDAPRNHAARFWFTMMARAVDVLAERDDLVDMNRVLATGGSQGGALALATAALDERVALCLADSPANCMLHEIVTKYPSFGPTLGQKPQGQTLQRYLRTLSYVDPVHLCPWIRCPTYIGCSVGDMTVHAMGPLAAYRNLTALDPSQKAFFPGPRPAHSNSAEAGAFFQRQRDRLAGAPLPEPP